MKPHHKSIERDQLCPTPAEHLPPAGPSVRSQWTAACAGLAIAVFLWTVASGLFPCNLHPGAGSRASITRLWDKHQDLTRAVAAIMPVPSRRPLDATTRLAAPRTATPLPRDEYRSPERRRPVTVAPHLAQVHLRAPPRLA